MPKPKTGERTTVLISAVMAIAILGAAVTAQQSRSTPRDRLASLESDLRFQLQLTWRQDRETFEARLKELDETLAAWQASPQTDRDRELLIEWLRESIVHSLPGESGELPPAPAFGAAPRKEIVASASTKHSVEIPSKSGPAKTQAGHAPTHRAAALPAEANRSTDRRPRILAQSKVEHNPAKGHSKKTPANNVPHATAHPPGSPTPPAAESTPPVERSVTARKPPLAGPSAPASTASTTNVVNAQPVAHSESKEPKQSEPKPAPPITVNLAELNARIGGYHDGLDEVEAAIVAARKAATRLRVTRLVAMVEELAAQRQFVQLYYDSLTKTEREFVLEPRPMTATVTLVEQQLERLEGAGDEDEDFLEADDGTAKLARRLRAVAEAVAE